MHEGDHVKSVRYCFNLVFFMYSGLCMKVMFVRRDDENKTKKTTRKNKNEKNENKHVLSAKRKVPSFVVQVTFLPASSLVARA